MAVNGGKEIRPGPEVERVVIGQRPEGWPCSATDGLSVEIVSVVAATVMSQGDVIPLSDRRSNARNSARNRKTCSIRIF